MIDPNKKYRTIEGREARIYAVDAGGVFPIHGAVLEGCAWLTRAWTCTGSFRHGVASCEDLVEVRPRIKRTYWANFYPHDRIPVLHGSKQRADEQADTSRIACVKIEIDCEEGDGL